MGSFCRYQFEVLREAPLGKAFWFFWFPLSFSTQKNGFAPFPIHLQIPLTGFKPFRATRVCRLVIT